MKILRLFWVLLVIALCGCSVPIDNESIAQAAEASSTTYNILVLEVSRAGAAVTWPQFGLSDPFATAIQRISYAQSNGSPFTHGIAPQYNILPPFTATPAQVGCGGSNEQHTAMQFAVAHAVQAGVNLSPYKHIWLVADDQHSFVAGGCGSLYGTSGGRNFGFTGLTDNAFGMIWTSSPQNAMNAVHEFEHGYAPNGLSHEYLLRCPNGDFVRSVASTGCTRTEVAPGGVPQFFNALSGNPANQNPQFFNENGWYKFLNGWLGPQMVAVINPGGVGSLSLTINEGASGSTFASLLRVNRWDGRFLLFERRQHAFFASNGTVDAPGVYAYVVEPNQSGDIPALIAGGISQGYFNDVLRVPPNSLVIQIEPGLVVQDNAPVPGFFKVVCNVQPGQACL